MVTIEEWVEALRSGDYVQGYQSLRQPAPGLEDHEYRYCCIGVLLNLDGPGRWKPRGWGTGSWHVSSNQLPDGDSLGVVDADMDRSDFARLAEMNDRQMASDDSSFEGIADYIEETYLNRGET